MFRVLSRSTPAFLVFAAVSAFASLLPPSASAQLGTAFTYQGGLKEDGVPATGAYDFEFRLFDASAGGALLAGPATVSAAPVANGLFTLDIDFGVNLFDGSAYFLETSVRATGGGGFTALAPRVELTAAPNAHFAQLAGDADTVDGAHAGDLFNQSLALNGNDLELTDGNGTLSVDLAALGGAGSDDDITAVTFAANTLAVEEGATMFSADLSSIQADWNNLQNVPADFADDVDDVDDADNDPANEIETWATLAGIPAGFADDIDNVNDADSSPANELNTGAGFAANTLSVTDAGGSVTADLSSIQADWDNLQNVPAGFIDGFDNVNDADSDPTNEIETWATLAGIPADFADDTDDVDDADADPANERNTRLQLVGATLELEDSGGTLTADLSSITGGLGDGHSLDAVDGAPVDAVFVDPNGNAGVGTTSPLAKLHVVGSLSGASVPAPLSQVADGQGGFNRLAGARSVFVSGTTAYVAASADNALSIINVANPANPQLLSQVVDGQGGFNNLGGARSVVVSGNTAYVLAFADNALTIIDVANPASPQLLGEAINGQNGFSRLGSPLSLFVDGATAYVASDLGGGISAVTIIDVANPANPQPLAEIVNGQGGFNNLGGANSVFVADDIAYVTAFNANAVTIIDVADPANPQLLGEAINGQNGFSGLSGANSVFVDGGTAYATAFFSNTLTIIDVANPANPQPLAAIFDGFNGFNRLRSPRSVFVDGATAYVAAEDDDAVTIIDVSDPTNPQLLGEAVNGVNGFNRLDGAWSVFVSGGTPYVAADGSGSLTIIGETVLPAPGAIIEGDMGIGVTTPDTPLALRGNGGTLPVGITQNQVGGISTMELTTTDGTDRQATRLLLRGNGNNADIEFYTGARGAETQTVHIEGTNGNVGIGTSAPGTALEVNGTITASGLDASGAVMAGSLSTSGTATAASFSGDGSGLSGVHNTLFERNGDNLLLTDGDGTLSVSLNPFISTNIGEAGTVTVTQPDSTTTFTVNLTNDYTNPVVILGILAENDTDPTTLRVIDTTINSFDFRVEEWDYLDGAHGQETVSYLVLEEGVHILPDAILEAGFASVDHNPSTVNLTAPFSAPPIVLPQVMSVNGVRRVATRLGSVTATSFNARLQRQESINPTHPLETLGYVAISSGSTGLIDTLAFETGSVVADSGLATALFSAPFSLRPVWLPAIQTFNGSDPCTVQTITLLSNGADFRVDEEQSDDAEVDHGNETIGFLALEAGSITFTRTGYEFLDGTVQTTAAFGDGHSLDAVDGDPVDAVFVDADGNVGIGTTSPGAALEVSGAVSAGSFATSGAVMAGSLMASGTVMASSFVGDGSMLTGITDNVDDADANPTNELQILSGTGSQVALSNGGGTLNISALAASDGTPANAVSVDADGDAGIGTASPAAALHVSRATDGQAQGLQLTNGATNSVIYNENGDLILRKLNQADQLVLDTGGNVGVGTADPAATLHVAGDLRVEGGSPAPGLALVATNSSGDLAYGRPIPRASNFAVSESIVDAGSSSGFQNIGPSVTLNGLRAGDAVLLMASFRFQIRGGSGNDDVIFRFRGAAGGCPDVSFGGGSGLLETFDERRDQFQPFSFQRMGAVQCDGDYTFQVQVDANNADDELVASHMEITALRLY